MRKPRRSSRQVCALHRIVVSLYENLASYALALQRFDEARQIIREAQARKLDDYGSTVLSMLLLFSGRTPPRWRNSNSGLRASPNMRTLDLRSHPIPRHMAVILARRGN